MVNAKKIKKSVRYANFHITNAATKYTLHENGYTGTLDDALKLHNRQKFSTFDSDNDSSSMYHCASNFLVRGGGGCWWFQGCYSTHLNGKYYSGGEMSIG